MSEIKMSDLKSKSKCTNPDCPYLSRAVLFSMTEFFKECEKPEFRNELYEKEISSLQEKVKELEAAAEMLWTVIANVSGGDWDKQSEEWQEAAIRWRDNYFTVAYPKNSKFPNTHTPPRKSEESK